MKTIRKIDKEFFEAIKKFKNLSKEEQINLPDKQKIYLSQNFLHQIVEAEVNDDCTSIWLHVHRTSKSKTQELKLFTTKEQKIKLLETTDNKNVYLVFWNDIIHGKQEFSCLVFGLFENDLFERVFSNEADYTNFYYDKRKIIIKRKNTIYGFTAYTMATLLRCHEKRLEDYHSYVCDCDKCHADKNKRRHPHGCLCDETEEKCEYWHSNRKEIIKFLINNQ